MPGLVSRPTPHAPSVWTRSAPASARRKVGPSGEGRARSKAAGAAAIRSRARVRDGDRPFEGFAIDPDGAAARRRAGRCGRSPDRRSSTRETARRIAAGSRRSSPARAAPGPRRATRARGIDVDPAIALDVEDALDVEHVQLVVPAERDGPRALAELHAVVEELEMHALVGAPHPREEELRHSRVRLDAVGERVVHRLVAPDLEPAPPGALDQRRRRRDHEEQVDDLPEAREQVAARLVRIGSEAVEAEAIDQQVRHVAAARPCAPCSGRASASTICSSSPVNAPAYL